MHRICTAQHIRQQCGILDTARHRTDLVERGRKRNQTIARYRAVGRLETDYAAERRRLTNRAAGVRTDCERNLSRRNDRRGAAGRAAGHVCRIVRIAGLLQRRVLTGGAHCKLVQIGFTGNDQTRLVQLVHHSRIVKRHEILKHFRRTSRLSTLGADVVLDRDRNARQRRKRLARRALFVDLGRPAHRRVEIRADVRADGAFHLLGARCHRLGQLTRADFPALQKRRELGGSFLKQFHQILPPHSTTRGTLTPPHSTTGAFARISSRG